MKHNVGVVAVTGTNYFLPGIDRILARTGAGRNAEKITPLPDLSWVNGSHFFGFHFPRRDPPASSCESSSSSILAFSFQGLLGLEMDDDSPFHASTLQYFTFHYVKVHSLDTPQPRHPPTLDLGLWTLPGLGILAVYPAPNFLKNFMSDEAGRSRTAPDNQPLARLPRQRFPASGKMASFCRPKNPGFSMQLLHPKPILRFLKLASFRNFAGEPGMPHHDSRCNDSRINMSKNYRTALPEPYPIRPWRLGGSSRPAPTSAFGLGTIDYSLEISFPTVGFEG